MDFGLWETWILQPHHFHPYPVLIKCCLFGRFFPGMTLEKNRIRIRSSKKKPDPDPT